MKLDIYQIDAFTNKVFGGNPAAVCPLEEWLSDELMQAIALENNLSETVFFVNEAEGLRIRWFTPLAEVKLCGHATVAAAFVLFNLLNYSDEKIVFNSLSGKLFVTRSEDGWITLDFPAIKMTPCSSPKALWEGLGAHPIECYKETDYLAVFEDEQTILDIQPDFKTLETLDARGLIITAPGKNCDFVSRFFAPTFGIDEDPVTGSAHCALTPYWSKKLTKKSLNAKQLSNRGGILKCSMHTDRVNISGQAVLYLQGQIDI